MDYIEGKNIGGIHHITAISGNARENLTFFTKVLGLRFIKKTVNFDDPGVYHLYFADKWGTPGSVLTLFPYEGTEAGRNGSGMVNTISFSAPYNSVTYWESRLDDFGINRKRVQSRFDGERYIYFEDSDGLSMELVFTENDERKAWTGEGVPEEYAVKGFFGAEIRNSNTSETSALLTQVMDHELIKTEGKRQRYAVADKPGAYIDLVDEKAIEPGIGGTGTVHHIAFRTAGTKGQEVLRRKLSGLGLYSTRIIDRKYFRSVYFREPGGVLFEIATDGPGFTVDEDIDSLGTSLMLPDQYEGRRGEIERLLPEL